MNISLDYTNILNAVSENEILEIQTKINKYNDDLYNKTGKGSDYLGWVTLPDKLTPLIDDIQKTADKIKSSDCLVVIGIGGSYLGAKAVIEACNGPFNTKKEEFPEILYAGHNISADYINKLLKYLKNKNFYVNVISKSGTTTEPSLAFRFIMKLCKEKYGDEFKNRIIATTDSSKGALKKLSDSIGMKTYVIPDDIGGRFSVLTPVGLLPIAVSGINIKELVKGAIDMSNISKNKDILKNPAHVYAAIRYLMYKKNKSIELLSNFEPAINYISEWWKQLYGESEGKDKKGLFPASVNFTTDLHSMGQYIQDGLRIIFETFIKVNNSVSIKVPFDKENLDGLNFISEMEVNKVNEKAYEGTRLAHLDGGIPNITIELPEISPYYIGQLIYFFEKAVGISGYLLEVNPFDQPGVEAYKKNMFALLNKPGFENENKAITERINSRKNKIINIL